MTLNFSCSVSLPRFWPFSVFFPEPKDFYALSVYSPDTDEESGLASAAFADVETELRKANARKILYSAGQKKEEVR